MPDHTVVVTGGSGYIAGFLIRQLVAEGWRVHATVRSLDKEAALRTQLAVDNARLHLFAAELQSDTGWAEAMAGCSHVAHVASPVPAGPRQAPGELIGPARDGALRALRFARAAGVRRFVMTSSVSAVAYGRRDAHGDQTFTEADWTNPERSDISAYAKGKTLAERAAREWVAREATPDFEFCSICPSVVFGPLWSRDNRSSVSIIGRLLDGGVSATPDLGFGVVDVRDAADLHVRALRAPGVAGERFIASGRYVKLREMADLLRAELGDQAHKVTTRNAPDWLVRVSALFSAEARVAALELGVVRHLDASHAKAVLGWQTRPAERSIVDCARSLLELGLART
ncbi:MAG: NAD-dependent epimerase/dehydratase family protein [Rubrivivax sp.]|nr:NAD-dependent epimerase/dehydratase family protein [Rubrivivax sp.]